MKKLFTLAAAFGCFTFAANAQRLVDISATMNNPIANFTIDSGVAFQSKVVVTNVGANPLKAGDSIIYSWYLDGNGLVFGGGSSTTVYYSSSKLGKVLNQNDTIQINANFSIGYTTTTTTDKTVQYCIAVAPINRSADSVKDNVTTNNQGCKSIIMKANYNPPPSGVATVTGTNVENQVSLYPNPVSTEAKFNLSMNNIAEVSLKIFDVTGRLVISENKGKMSGNNTINVSTKNLQNGIYLYRVEMGSDIQTGKMLVSQQ